MADDDEATTPEERAARQRASAQDAAADLVRMGIDPRSLGLEPPSAPTDPPVEAPDPDLAPPALGSERSAPDPPVAGSEGSDRPGGGQHARVVALRPDRGAGSGSPPTGGHPSGTGTGTPDPRMAVPVPGRPTGAAAPAPARPVPAAGPLEQLLARTLLARPVPAASGRMLRSVARGLVTPDAAGAAGEERELVAAARSRQFAPRVVAFVAGKGGVGTTTAALGAGAALAALRDDRAAVVDMRSGTPSLGIALAGQPAPSARSVARDERSEPLALPGGLRLVDGTGWSGALRRTDVAPLLDHLSASHAFSLLDVGNDPGDAAEVALARADQVVIVTEAGRSGLAAARAAAERITDIDPFAVDLAVYVVACTRDEPYREVLRRAQQQLSVAPARLVVVPPDPHLAAGEAFDAAALRPATREALLQVAASLALGERTAARRGQR